MTTWNPTCPICDKEVDSFLEAPLGSDTSTVIAGCHGALVNIDIMKSPPSRPPNEYLEMEIAACFFRMFMEDAMNTPSL